MTFGEKLYYLRTEQKLSQEALARKLGVTRQAISRWELGEVVPDTANVLAVSRQFGVSADFLLREDHTGNNEAVLTETTEMNLNERQLEVGKGMFCRFGALAGPAVWHLHAHEPSRLLLIFALGITLLFGILLACTMKKVRRQDMAAAKCLLRRDIFSALCICILPAFLKKIPGNWEIFLAQLTVVPALQKNWIELRMVYDLPVKSPKK